MNKLFAVVAAIALAGAGCFAPAAPAPEPVPLAVPPNPAPDSVVPETSSTGTDDTPADDAMMKKDDSVADEDAKIKKDDAMKPEIATVLIQGYAYVPNIISVKKGTRVTFTNKDSVGHTVTADNGEFKSLLLKQNSVYELSTGQLAPGSYTFHCEPHPTMKGTLVIE